MQLTSKLSLAAAAAFILAGCSAYPSMHAAAVPVAIAAPADTHVFLEVQATGVQIYRCARKADATFGWQLVAPEAELRSTSGALVGKHYAGPTWETNDGSKAAGEVKASAPGSTPSAIAQLLLSVKSHSGSGPIAEAKYVQRLDTAGGVAPADGCDAVARVDAQARVPYTARYVFYR